MFLANSGEHWYSGIAILSGRRLLPRRLWHNHLVKTETFQNHILGTVTKTGFFGHLMTTLMAFFFWTEARMISKSKKISQHDKDASIGFDNFFLTTLFIEVVMRIHLTLVFHIQMKSILTCYMWKIVQENLVNVKYT